MFHAKLPPGSHFRHPISSFCTERHLVANKWNTLIHFICSCTPGSSLALLHNNIMYLNEASIYWCQETTCFQCGEHHQVTSIEWANKQPAAMLSCARTKEGCVWVESITKLGRKKSLNQSFLVPSSRLPLSPSLSHGHTDTHTHSQPSAPLPYGLNTATSNGRSIWGSQLTSWPPSHFVDVTRMPNVKQKAVKDELGLKARLWAVIQSRRSLWGTICLPKKSCELLFSIRCIILRNHRTFQVKLV